jgi:hypothetical protein
MWSVRRGNRVSTFLKSDVDEFMGCTIEVNARILGFEFGELRGVEQNPSAGALGRNVL